MPSNRKAAMNVSVFEMTVWHAREQPHATQVAAVVTEHFRIDGVLVNEHQAQRL